MISYFCPGRISTTEVTEFFLERALRDSVSPRACSDVLLQEEKKKEEEEEEEDDDNETDFIALEEKPRSLGNY